MALRKRDILLCVLAFGANLLDETVGAGGRAYLAGKLFLWTPPSYPKNNFKQVLQRLKRQDLIEKIVTQNEVYWRLTQKGTGITFAKFPLISQQQKPWDRQWRIVYFDIPEKQARVRKQFRHQLMSLGFGQAQKSVYLSPYDFIREIKHFIQTNDLNEWVFLYEGKKVWLGEDNDKEMAAKIWHLDEIASMYRNWLKQYQLKAKDFTANNKRFLLSQYLELLRQDPLLPRELLPEDWIGFQIKTLAKNLL